MRCRLPPPPMAPRSPLSGPHAAPKGFVGVKDSNDGYGFLYPFGWQEVTVDGQDVVYKDVIEPLESVSVSLVPTEKADVTEFGDPKEVAFTLADKVLTAPSQEVTIINVGEVGAAAAAPPSARRPVRVSAPGRGPFCPLWDGCWEERPWCSRRGDGQARLVPPACRRCAVASAPGSSTMPLAVAPAASVRSAPSTAGATSTSSSRQRTGTTRATRWPPSPSAMVRGMGGAVCKALLQGAAL